VSVRSHSVTHYQLQVQYEHQFEHQVQHEHKHADTHIDISDTDRHSDSDILKLIGIVTQRYTNK